MSSRPRASDPTTLERLYGASEDLLPLWIAEPSVDLAPGITAALEARAGVPWYGYEIRPRSGVEAFWGWMAARHGWDGTGLQASVSPSVGTSIAMLIEQHSEQADGVIIQPPVFTDFKPIVTSAGRTAVRNPLVLTDDGYRMDLDDLEAKASESTATMMILCNPHNPVGRVWTQEELSSVATICARHDVFVVADEIHADLALPPHRFTPFATAAGSTDVAWAATHGPIKTFGLAGVCDSLLVTGDEALAKQFRATASRLHLNRNNVFGLVASEAGYRTGGEWLDDLLDLVATNVTLLRDRLPEGIELVEPEGTYLAWLDFRELGMDVPELARWLPSTAHLALSPGHWFGRQGAGFARMTIAVPTTTIETAVGRLTEAVSGTNSMHGAR
jgi:cystathionine beta-lyase